MSKDEFLELGYDTLAKAEAFGEILGDWQKACHEFKDISLEDDLRFEILQERLERASNKIGL